MILAVGPSRPLLVSDKRQIHDQLEMREGYDWTNLGIHGSSNHNTRRSHRFELRTRTIKSETRSKPNPLYAYQALSNKRTWFLFSCPSRNDVTLCQNTGNHFALNQFARLIQVVHLHHQRIEANCVINSSQQVFRMNRFFKGRRSRFI